MLSKTKIKFFNTLIRKKKRDELGVFLAEGVKLINELIDAKYKIEVLACTPSLIHSFHETAAEIVECSHQDIKKISQLKTPQDAVAIVRKPDDVPVSISTDDLVLALDEIQDPGNLGTIIRLASWFGIKSIVCSRNTADCYNPKVVQATMGAIAHVHITYTDLANYLTEVKENNLPIYGTLLSGNNIYADELTAKGVIVMGNEGNGISAPIHKLIDQALFIPSFSQNAVESLNVSVATAIILSEFKRRL